MRCACAQIWLLLLKVAVRQCVVLCCTLLCTLCDKMYVLNGIFWLFGRIQIKMAYTLNKKNSGWSHVHKIKAECVFYTSVIVSTVQKGQESERASDGWVDVFAPSSIEQCRNIYIKHTHNIHIHVAGPHTHTHNHLTYTGKLYRTNEMLKIESCCEGKRYTHFTANNTAETCRTRRLCHQRRTFPIHLR